MHNQFASALLAISLASHGSLALAADVADRIWHGGPVITMNDAAMRAEAVAEKDGKILAVGTKDEVMAHQGDSTQLIDLAGRTMIPGFVDSHGHVFGGGLQAMSANLLAPPDGVVTDIQSMQKVINDWVKANREIVEQMGLIIGFGYDNATLAEHRHPTRDELDNISVDIPVYVIHQSGHFGVANSKALEIAGITRETLDPAGGIIRRGPDGEPNGVLEETAHFPALMKLMTRVGVDGAKAMARAGAKLWASFGYTTAQEGRSTPGSVKIMQAVAAEGGFPIDVATYPDILIDRDFIAANISRTYENRLRVAGAKLTIDGSPQGFTAWRDRPYFKPVGDYPPGYAGYAAASSEQVVDAVDWSYAKGIQLLTHANGEAASDLLIAAIDAAQKKHGKDDRRPVLIHGQFLREDQVASFDRLDVFPSLFPMHTFYWGDWHREHTAGPVLANNISPTGWVRSRHMRFGTHHDAPVAFPDSMRVLDATVTRRSRSGDILGPDHRVDVITALKAMTIWPAWQHFEEDSKGSIEPGKLADLVILSDDPTAVDPETLDQLKVVKTIKEGVTIFSLEEKVGEQAGLIDGLPGARSGEAFSRFLQAAATYRDFIALPQKLRTPMSLKLLNKSPHQKACVASVMSDIVAAVVEGERL
ncbi:MAG: amidohydrolase [Gammaproteobacteria bacterium]|jgi:predicted amidohydrolase YtcJ